MDLLPAAWSLVGIIKLGALFAPKPKEYAMAKMCPLSGCKSCEGMCGHDKMMIGMGLLMMLGAVMHWGLHLV